MVREVIGEVRENLAAVNGMSPTEHNRLVDRFVGPMAALPDGTVAKKKETPARAGGQLPGGVWQGGRFEPLASAL
jgi:hypothetical protein